MIICARIDMGEHQRTGVADVLRHAVADVVNQHTAPATNMRRSEHLLLSIPGEKPCRTRRRLGAISDRVEFLRLQTGAHSTPLVVPGDTLPTTTRTGAGTVRAEARFRDWDGEVRKVTATESTVKAAKQALRAKLAKRGSATGFGAALSPESTVADLTTAWLDDVRIRTDLAEGTKDLYAREVNSLILPHLKNVRLREVTVGRADQFIKKQATVSYAHAKHSKRMLSMLLAYALRHDAVHHNPVAGTARLKEPTRKPQSLTYQQITQVRNAAATWHTGKSVCGPRPDGQVRDVIEVMLGTSDRIGEALGLRKCDIDDSRAPDDLPMRVGLESFDAVAGASPGVDEHVLVALVRPLESPQAGDLAGQRGVLQQQWIARGDGLGLGGRKRAGVDLVDLAGVDAATHDLGDEPGLTLDGRRALRPSPGRPLSRPG
ncbi:site-specific integrase [Cellulomonas hominis]